LWIAPLVHKHANTPHAVGLLRTHGERPNGCRSRDRIDEIASPHASTQGSKQGIVTGQTGRLEVVKTALGNLRFGLKADVMSALPPESGHR
jgi:hypothetical protein